MMNNTRILIRRFYYFFFVLILAVVSGFVLDGTKKTRLFTLPSLPYKADALVPVISENTINFHYGKHLQTYISNLNGLIIDTPFADANLETIVKNSDGAIFNNAAQAWNHEFYFNTFSPNARQTPDGELLKAIEKEWGSFDQFKKEFVAAGTSIFGSGWVWLAQTSEGKLMILKEINAGNPLTKGYIPLLGVDVWEHAYYIDYQNRRSDHLNALWTIIDWETIESRFK